MEFHLRTHSVEIDTYTREYAEEKIGRAVRKVVGKEGSRVDVEISDPAQGTGTPICRVTVKVSVPRTKPAVVHVEQAEPRAAIDLASDKILNALKRGVQKKRDKARKKNPAASRPRLAKVATQAAPVSDDADEAETLTM